MDNRCINSYYPQQLNATLMATITLLSTKRQHFIPAKAFSVTPGRSPLKTWCQTTFSRL